MKRGNCFLCGQKTRSKPIVIGGKEQQRCRDCQALGSGLAGYAIPEDKPIGRHCLTCECGEHGAKPKKRKQK
jgi:hypothetical protein